MGFFGISGFLITGSRFSGQGARAFYRARCLRILPGFLVCILLIAFVAAPLAGRFGPGAYSLHSASTYVVRNLALYPPEIAQAGIGTTLAGTPYDGHTWDGSLWTLFWEAMCYVGVGVAGSLMSRRRVGVVATGAFVVSTSVLALHAAGAVRVPGLAGDALLLMAAFAAGAAIHVHRDHVPTGWITASACAVVLAISCVSGTAGVISQLPFTLLLRILGARLPLSAVGSRNDISYGLYIYGAVVQQVISLATRQNRLPLPLYLAIALAGATVLAWASWLVVEKPALRHKSRGGRRAPEPVPSVGEDVDSGAADGSVASRSVEVLGS